jgi:hypothetical protein
MKRLVRLISVVALGAGCSSSSPSGPVGGAVTGAADEHCGPSGDIMATKVGMCVDPTAWDGGAGADDGGVPLPDYGETLFNAEGYDDECKYRVSFTSTPVRLNDSVTFTVTIAGLDPTGPAKDADLQAEVFLDGLHPAPNTNTTTTETSDGVYKIGPIKFDAPGRWTVRFHLYDRCAETSDTPHGHVAFYIDVPSPDAGTGA